MSSTLIENPTQAGDTTQLGVVESDRAGAHRSSSPWTWMILACLFLGISGGVRFWRDYEFAKRSTADKQCPFPLADLSSTLGTWHAVDNSDMKLDPEIARIAGSTDHVIRTYADSKSGEKVHVMVLYGLAESVHGHTPEVCYPASGHRTETPPKEQDIPIPELSRPAHFRTQIFYRPLGPGNGEYTEVYYAFRHAGHWQPDMAGEWKKFRYEPGMFKIQTSREVSAAAVNPDAAKSKVSESLVTEIIKEIERRVALKNASVNVAG